MEETEALIKSSEPQHTKNVIQALLNEYQIMYAGLQNQEYLDYCFVKGASGQTVPLALLLPVGLFLGVVNILSKATTNIIEGDYILSNLVYVILQVCGLCIVLYLLLKACEVIPKKIQNPLLFGRVTTYVFMCLLIAMGILVVERIVEGQARTYHTSQFWVVFALIIWQKILVLFIYDYKVRFAAFLFLYTYYAFRVSGEEFRWAYNLLKASVYIILELVMVIDRELKDYADYQLENNIQTKQVLDEVVPPMRMFQQQFLLESYLKVFPVVIFDQTKELLNISSETLKLLGQNDLFQAEKQLRKLEIIEVFNRKEQVSAKEFTVKLTRQAKFGSTCGVNEKGDLLHSLINGPALQQLRAQQQTDQPRLQTQGQLEQLLNELIKGDQDYLKGLLVLKLSKEKQFYFSFHLIRNKKIYLFLDDVSDIMKLQMKNKDENYETKEIKDINILLSQIRQISTLKSYPIPTKIQNIEIKSCYLEQNQLRINYDKINFDQMVINLQEYYKQRIPSIKYQFKNLIKLNTSFFTDEERLRQIIDIIMENSIEQTKDGFIGITFENDARPNCIQVSIQDTGIGINLELMKDEMGSKLSGLFIANYLTKILGVSFFNKKINGQIANKGLRIVTTQEYGTKISFTLRNMLFDQNNVFFLIDENLEEDEQNQDEILERYLIEDQTQYLNRLKKPIKYIVMKNEEKKVVQLLDDRQVKRPQLKGMMKLQESGRLKSLTTQVEQLQIPLEKCICATPLIINSDHYFSSTLKDFNFQIANEFEALKMINIKLKENPCIQKGCLAYNKIFINCSNPKVNYDDLVKKLLLLNKQLNIIVLSYLPWGELQPNIAYYQMPTKLDTIFK
ncbi:unnamed protein product (macronuclear) [Paramecium tetraurelia]|uniref:Histidine kinase/HSP90-like ATPase domain-containing protein n=1 Tax=Paramecium tetraurelia TaxID=5888 RepID=A0DMN7_PARTE|nr:uncharacterized protein GSPATT00018508001 [Paramecium tetraurelia]CAK84304.1 unnamed protein product [Paramecium tetraurelia]|eukprot:XP_001451701.1 hypothetical protein (macronuclear) [Paramecium tetraurelia strain d4-2]